MNSVTIIISTYNGSKHLDRQLKSILSQINVDMHIYIRDDGSTDDSTRDILERYKQNYSNIDVDFGKNVGWQQSFMLGLEAAPKADFYAFSDQDDLWFDNKLATAILSLKKEDPQKALLFHCNKISTDQKLKPLSNQIIRLPKPINHQNALVQEYAQGCSIVINETARNLILKKRPLDNTPHDYWCGLICYLFGKIIYDAQPYFYHISYGLNASGEGHLWKSRLLRLKSFFAKQNVYHIPIEQLLEGYLHLLDKEDKDFLVKLQKYKKSITTKLSILFSSKFRRNSILGTLSLKLAILLNKI